MSNPSPVKESGTKQIFVEWHTHIPDVEELADRTWVTATHKDGHIIFTTGHFVRQHMSTGTYIAWSRTAIAPYVPPKPIECWVVMRSGKAQGAYLNEVEANMNQFHGDRIIRMVPAEKDQ
jgi:hypothetical protein